MRKDFVKRSRFLILRKIVIESTVRRLLDGSVNEINLIASALLIYRHYLRKTLRRQRNEISPSRRICLISGLGITESAIII